MSVRPATEADFPMMCDLGAKFHAASDDGGVYDPETFTRFLNLLLAEGCIFVSERGMIGGYAWPSPWAKDFLIAMEAFWWAEDGQGRALADAYEAWAGSVGAGSTRMGYIEATQPERVASILRKRGYRPLETIMVK